MIILAVEDDDVVGIASLTRPNDDIISFESSNCIGLTEVGTVFVSPERRRHGIGAALWLSAVMQIKRRGETALCFDSGYPLAQKTWQHRFGMPQFEIINRWGEGTRHMIWKLDVEAAMSCVLTWLKSKQPFWFQTSLQESGQYITRPGAYAVLMKGETIGIIKTPTGYFLAGGGIEADETPEMALERECLEEIGAKIDSVTYLGVGEHYFLSTTERRHMHSVGYFYTCSIKAFAQAATEPDHELVWLTAREAVEKLYLDHQSIAIQLAIKEEGGY
jgi:8-oxo-dGTP diphosphatase